jgi:pimeloyl-ACP methyl ester carboxylesterase
MVIGHKLVGSGAESVIVMPGWFGDHTVFAPMLPYLDGKRFSYAFVDYRGYGSSRDIAGEHTMAELAADAIALADHHGWKRFHAVGHSMGGKAIARIIAEAKGRMKSGVALTPVSAAGMPLEGDMKALFEGAIDSDEKRRFILDFSTGNRLSGAWLDWMVKRSRETTTRDAYAGYLHAFTAGSFVEHVQGDPTPVLVAVGEFDQALTAEVMRQTWLAFHPKAELVTLPNAGHYPMLETPVYLATVMERFMAAHV